MGFGPQVVDLDQDGTNDILSGSWPGALYMFKGSKGEDGTGTYATPVTLKDKDGKEINTGNASALFATDWDRDGDIDLVIGSIDGWVWYIANESGTRELKFGTAVKVAADGKEIREHHSGPTIADWDGNGTLDLIVGQGDGRVVWYSNSARAGAPKLAAAKELVPANPGHPDGSRCGNRVKPHVCDWNGDGKLDLLLGDFSIAMPKMTEVSEEQAARRDELMKSMEALEDELMPVYIKITKGIFEEMGIKIEGEGESALQRAFDGLSPEQQQAYLEKLKEAHAGNEDIKAAQKKMMAIQTELQGLMGQATVNGNVWVMLRGSAAPTTGHSSR